MKRQGTGAGPAPQEAGTVTGPQPKNRRYPGRLQRFVSCAWEFSDFLLALLRRPVALAGFIYVCGISAFWIACLCWAFEVSPLLGMVILMWIVGLASFVFS